MCAVATVSYIENETHVISNTVESISNSIEDTFDNVKNLIVTYTTTLIEKNNYDSYEKHHIVARIDHRAKFSRRILALSKIDINDQRNLVYIKKGYHRVIHTNLYYGILDISIGTGYLLNGSEGGEDVLEIYQKILGGL